MCLTRVLVCAFVWAVCVHCLLTRTAGLYRRWRRGRKLAPKESDFLPFPEACGDTRVNIIFFFRCSEQFPIHSSLQTTAMQST